MSMLLIVEDEFQTTDLLREYFQRAGYEVITTFTGADAVRKTVSHRPEVIILDINLPDMDGYAVCKQLRGDSRTSRIPIIFLTERASRSDRIDGLELGADDYLTKPFDPEELRLRVQNILHRLPSGNHEEAYREFSPQPEPPEQREETSMSDELAERLLAMLGRSGRHFLNVEIKRYGDFRAKYGAEAAEAVADVTGELIDGLLYSFGVDDVFISQPRPNHYLLGLPARLVERFRSELKLRFGKRVMQFYDYSDQRRGSMVQDFEEVPFMSLKMTRVNREALRIYAAKLRREKMSGPPRLPFRSDRY